MTTLTCTSALHQALKADPIEWSRLQPIGVIPAFAPGGKALELRACAACHSTLCKPIDIVGLSLIVDGAR